MPDVFQTNESGTDNISSPNDRMFTRVTVLLVILTIIGIGYIGYRFLNKPTVSITKTVENQEVVPVEDANTGTQLVSDEQNVVNPNQGTDIPQTALNKVPEKDKAELEAYLKKYYYDSLPASTRTTYNLTQDNVVIRITRFLPGFARGTTALELPEGVPGAVWWVAKVDGSWKVVETTQEPPTCSIMTQYKFPQEIYESCLDK